MINSITNLVIFPLVCALRYILIISISIYAHCAYIMYGYVAGQNEIQVKMKCLRLLSLHAVVIHRS